MTAAATKLLVAGGSLSDQFKSNVAVILESRRNRIAVCKWAFTPASASKQSERCDDAGDISFIENNGNKLFSMRDVPLVS